MSYSASVEQVTSSRLRQKQAKIRRPQVEGDKAQYDDDIDVGVGIGGPIIDFGREGGVRLESGKGGWKWTWVNQKGNEDSLIAAEGVLLYPGCRNKDVELGDVPASKIADSAVSATGIREWGREADLTRSTMSAHCLMCRSMPPSRTLLWMSLRPSSRGHQRKSTRAIR
jgi:hypothetical protein